MFCQGPTINCSFQCLLHTTLERKPEQTGALCDLHPPWLHPPTRGSLGVLGYILEPTQSLHSSLCLAMRADIYTVEEAPSPCMSFGHLRAVSWFSEWGGVGFRTQGQQEHTHLFPSVPNPHTADWPDVLSRPFWFVDPSSCQSQAGNST